MKFTTKRSLIMYFYHIVFKWDNQCYKKTKRTTESLSTQLQTSDKNDNTGNNHPNSWIRWTTSKVEQNVLVPLSVSTFRYDDRTKSIYSETYIKHIDRRRSSEYGSSLWKKSNFLPLTSLAMQTKREKDTHKHLYTHLIIIHPYRRLHTRIHTHRKQVKRRVNRRLIYVTC